MAHAGGMGPKLKPQQEMSRAALDQVFPTCCPPFCVLQKVLGVEALWVCWEARIPWGGPRLGPGFHQLEHFWPSCHLPGRATGATPGRCQDGP